MPQGSSVNYTKLTEQDLYMQATKLDTDSNQCIYIVIKIFNINRHTFLTVWQEYGFPYYPKTNEGRVINNPNNISYFQLGSIKLVVIEDLAGSLASISPYNFQSNQYARCKMEEGDSCEPLFHRKDPKLETWMLKREKVKKVAPILPPKFKNEQLFVLQLIDE